MYDLSESVRISENSFMEAFNLRSEVELAFQKDSISEGLALFEQIFGFRSSSFIAPCYTWSRSLNETLLSGGVTILQGNYFQLEPRIGDKHKFKRIIHFTGQKNSLGQVYLVRNAAFEPSQAPDFNFIEEILRRGNIAFGLGKPLIIGSHRLNYIGSIDQKNRDRNLLLLSRLLHSIVTRWPDVEFMSSDELGVLIKDSN
jgi:hypothetical protein